MSVAKEQREKLIWEFPNIGKKAPEQEEKAFAYCEGYKEFLNAAKTEREFVREAVLRLKEAGYEEFEEGKIYQPGDKVYQINRKKALLMTRSENVRWRTASALTWLTSIPRAWI